MVTYILFTICQLNYFLYFLNGNNPIICAWIFSETLDKIQNLVEEKFQDIRNTSKSCFHPCGQPCKSEHLQVQFYYILMAKTNYFLHHM